MFLTEIFEQQTPKHAAFCFGRMNPPTVGHGQLIDTVANASQGGDYFIFVSQSQDSKKNPLDYATKVKFVKALFPQHAGHVVYHPELKTIMQVANWLYSKGYRSVTFVAGSDRLASFKELLTKYNGQEDGYKFDSIDFVSSGDRDPDADGIAGVSASSAREAASQGNFEAFAQATGAGKLAKPLYDAVRKGMLLESNNDPKSTIVFSGIQIKFSPDRVAFYKGTNELYSKEGNYANPTPMQINTAKGIAYRLADRLAFPADKTNPNFKGLEKKLVDEGASGYIPKNKKEAKDPRWSNALTVDVHPDTPDKNMKALGLI